MNRRSLNGGNCALIAPRRFSDRTGALPFKSLSRPLRPPADPPMGVGREGGWTIRSLAVINAKGGVLKTSTALALAAGMAKQAAKAGRKPVLLVDADSQAHSTLILTEQEAKSPTIREVLMDECEARDAIRPTRIKGLDILPAAADLAACTTLLQDETGRELRLRCALRSIERRYSVVLVDSAPQVTLVTMSVLRGVNELIVPVDASLFALSALGKLRDIVSDVRRLLDHPELTIIGLLLVRAGPIGRPGSLRRNSAAPTDRLSTARRFPLVRFQTRPTTLTAP